MIVLGKRVFLLMYNVFISIYFDDFRRWEMEFIKGMN